MSFNYENVKYHQRFSLKPHFNCNVFNWKHYILHNQYCEIIFSVFAACFVFSLGFFCLFFKHIDAWAAEKEEPVDWSVNSQLLVVCLYLQGGIRNVWKQFKVQQKLDTAEAERIGGYSSWGASGVILLYVLFINSSIFFSLQSAQVWKCVIWPVGLIKCLAWTHTKNKDWPNADCTHRVFIYKYVYDSC